MLCIVFFSNATCFIISYTFALLNCVDYHNTLDATTELYQIAERHVEEHASGEAQDPLLRFLAALRDGNADVETEQSGELTQQLDAEHALPVQPSRQQCSHVTCRLYIISACRACSICIRHVNNAYNRTNQMFNKIIAV